MSRSILLPFATALSVQAGLWLRRLLSGDEATA